MVRRFGKVLEEEIEEAFFLSTTIHLPFGG